jgi:hypothetical protein
VIHVRQPETHEIKGTKYLFVLIPPPEALKILTRLIKRTLPSVGGALSGSDLKGMAEALSGEINLESLTSKLAENMEEDEIQDTIKILLKYAKIGGRDIDFNVDFAGELMTMFEVISKVMEVNYRDFLDGLKEKFAAAVRKVASQKQSQSTGISGDLSSLK